MSVFLTLRLLIHILLDYYGCIRYSLALVWAYIRVVLFYYLHYEELPDNVYFYYGSSRNMTDNVERHFCLLYLFLDNDFVRNRPTLRT